MQRWSRRRNRPSLRWLAGWILAGGLSATACSGDAEGGSDPDSSDSLPLGNGQPRMRSESTDDETPAMEGAPTPTEGNPDPAGLDTSGMTGTQQPEETDLEAPVMMSLDVPDTDYCELAAEWDPEWVQFEEEVLLLVNENRSRAANCGAEGMFTATTPLTTNPILRCAARLQSRDMFEREFFDHTNPDGIDPFERMDAAGFVGNAMGENIAQGQVSPEQVMQSWMESDGHCSNVMSPNFSLIGVGYHPGAGQRGLGSNYWTQNFGAPRRR